MNSKYVLSLISFVVFFILLLVGFDLIKSTAYNIVGLLYNSEYTYLFSILFSTIIIMFCWIIYFFINLRKVNNKLNATLNELNYQKLALDEHAIVSMTDVNGNIIYVNDQFCKISGYGKDELIGQNHRILKSDEHSKKFFLNLKETILSGKVWSGEVKNKKKNGDFYWVRATIVPFLDLKGKPFRYVSIRTDITEVKNTEKQLIKAINIADESNRIKSDFLANMSHELKTPLNSINIISSVMMKNKNKKLDDEQVKNLNIINRCGKDLLFLINDVLDISKLDAGEIKIDYELIDFKHFILDINEMFISQTLEKKLKLNLEYDEKIEIIYNDELRIKQIIVNLLSNAVKFTQKGQIDFIIKDEDEFISIVVKDQGIGIEENKLKGIFDRFNQVDGTITRKYGGTGLGLAISKELASLLNGEILVESVLDEGTIFTFRFEKDFRQTNQSKKTINIPINNSNEIEEKKEHLDILSSSEIKLAKLNNANILMLNDNPTSLFNIFVELKRRAKKIDLVSDIEDFLEKTKECDYDKIIINITETIYDDLNHLNNLNDYSKELYLICNNNLQIASILRDKAKIIFDKKLDKEFFLSQLDDQL